MAVREPSEIETPTEGFQTFRIQPQLLVSGKQVTVLAKSDILTATVMVADSGGETVVHTHRHMDQLFVVLAGQATFYSSRDEVAAVLGPFEGILVPRGATYWYEKTSAENLVLFRTIAVDPHAERTSPRFSEQLRPAAPVVTREGAYFGA